MSMKQFEGNMKSMTDTPFGYTLKIIGRKWRLVIGKFGAIVAAYPVVVKDAAPYTMVSHKVDKV